MVYYAGGIKNSLKFQIILLVKAMLVSRVCGRKEGVGYHSKRVHPV